MFNFFKPKEEEQILSLKGSCKLIFHRNKSYRGHIRTFDILLDDQLVGKIAKEQTLEITCPEGMHSLYIRLDMLRSQMYNFTMEENQVRSFDIACTMENGIILVEADRAKYKKTETEHENES